ncbi:potassium channel family protein [Tuwongella immobilis]|uniref:potassium channel family protein n=1 Tax=Tuwongella immobilis TaxID=692036 RepID=UPI0013A6BC42|nr:potassium channel protein [Tuwongella immobilis]
MPWRVWLAIIFPAIPLTIGTLGYRIIEGPHWTIADAFYMTSITLTTVGYLEVHELSNPGRMFTVFLAFSGIFALFFTATEIIRTIVSGEFRHLLGKERMARALAEMENHFIVCGYGRMGHQVCADFEKQRLPYVVIDQNEGVFKNFSSEFGVLLVGDATQDDVLRKAGITRAKAITSVLSSDAANLYIVLSARLLSDRLVIVARAEDSGAEEKLRRVGANKVISPYRISGHRIAQAVMRPTVVNFLEMATLDAHPELQIEEIRLHPNSPYVGKTLRIARIHQDLGIIIVGIVSANGHIQFSPQADTRLEAGDTLITLGRRTQLDQLLRHGSMDEVISPE